MGNSSIKDRTLLHPLLDKKFLKKIKNKFEKELKETLKYLESKLDENSNQNIIDNYNTTKKELENIELSEAAGHIMRSKAKWTELGENNSSYFLRLEKQNYI